MNSGNTKKVVDFLLMRQVFNSRNFVSLLLVAMFFGVYFASGGKIKPLPNVGAGDNFGNAAINQRDRVEPETVKARNSSVVQSAAKAPKRKLFDDRAPEATNLSRGKLADDVKPAVGNDDAEDDGDRLSDITNRLKSLRNEK